MPCEQQLPGLLAASDELLGGELPDRFKQSKPRRAVRVGAAAQHILVEQ